MTTVLRSGKIQSPQQMRRSGRAFTARHGTSNAVFCPSPVLEGGWLVTPFPRTGDRVSTIGSGTPLADGHRLLTIAAIEPESEHVTSYRLASLDGAALPAPAAGQFLPIAVDVPGHRVLRRSYSISAYEAGRYRLSIKRDRLPGQPPGRVSNHVLDHWTVGDRISAGTPQGRFVLDTKSNRPVVLLAGGIGITPLLAMLRDLAEREATRKVVLIVGTRHHRDHPFRAEMTSLARRMPNLTLHVRYSERIANACGEPMPDGFGRVDEALVRGSLPTPHADVYLCGPGPFMNAMYRSLVALGVPDQCIRFEAFGPASIERRHRPAPAATSAAGPLVSFAKSGLTAPFDPQALSLLEFAEDLGLSPPANCRSGRCGACITRKLSGGIRYAQEPSTIVADDEVLLCCALPEGPVTLDL